MRKFFISIAVTVLSALCFAQNRDSYEFPFRAEIIRVESGATSTFEITVVNPTDANIRIKVEYYLSDGTPNGYAWLRINSKKSQTFNVLKLRRPELRSFSGYMFFKSTGYCSMEYRQMNGGNLYIRDQITFSLEPKPVQKTIGTIR